MTIDYNDKQMQEVYLEQVKENYLHPVNKGKLEDYTFLAHYKNPSCGDSFDMYVKVNKDGVIEDIKYSGAGCAISTASMSLFSQEIIGKKLEVAKKFTEKNIYEILGIKISPTRINCAMLPLKTFQKGVKENNL